MSAGPMVRRAATVSVAAVAACTVSCGIANAAPVPLPSPPDPGSTVTSAEQTVTATVQQVTGTQPAPLPAAPTSTNDGATPTTPGKRALPKQPAAHVAAKPATRHHASPPAARTPSYVPLATLRFPPDMTWAQAPAAAPAVVAQQAPVTIRPVAGMAALDDLADHKGSPLRGLLLALAIVAAGALTVEHLRQARLPLAG